MTSNPKWREISAELLPTQEPNDRPDLIVRVFSLKLKELLNDIVHNQIFGKIIGLVYVIEFQKS